MAATFEMFVIMPHDSPPVVVKRRLAGTHLSSVELVPLPCEMLRELCWLGEAWKAVCQHSLRHMVLPAPHGLSSLAWCKHLEIHRTTLDERRARAVGTDPCQVKAAKP